MNKDMDIWGDKKFGRSSSPRLYDVRVTLNKSGDKRMVVRFGFINDAAAAFEGFDYIEVSDIEKLPDKIVFRLFNSKENANVHKLSYGKSQQLSRYFQITPSDKGDKIYRAKWIGGTFRIKLDRESGWHYIELSPEMEAEA